MATGTVTVNIIGDARKLKAALGESEAALAGFAGRAKKLGASMQALGARLTRTVTLPVVGLGVAAFKMSSDLTESMNAADIAFGESSAAVKKWADNLHSGFGFTRRGALDAASGFQLVTRDAGFTSTQMTDLAERAADLGSVFNASSEEVSAAIKSGLVGEMEPLRRFGVTLDQNKIQAEAVALGLIGVGEEMSVAQKQAATYSLIMKDTAFAQGDAVKTADEAAGRLRTLKADAGRLAETLGMKLIPVGVTILAFLKDLASAFSDLSPAMQNTILIAAGLAAAAGPLVFVIGSVLKVVGGVIVVIKAVGAAMAFLAANPIVLLIAAVALMAVLIIKHWDTIKAAFGVAVDFIRAVIGAVIGWLRANWDLLLPIFLGPIGVVIVIVRRFGSDLWAILTGAVSAVLGWMRGAWDGFVGFFAGIPGRIAGIASGMWEGIKSGFRAAINFIIRGWNRLSFSVPSFSVGPLKFGGQRIGVPRIAPLAEGGVVRRPTLALLGEAGPEAVVPLRNRRGVGGSIVINVAGSVISERDLVEVVRRGLVQTRMRGGLGV